MQTPVSTPQNVRLIAAFFAGQAVMFGLIALLRPLPAGAQSASAASGSAPPKASTSPGTQTPPGESEAVTTPALVVRRSATGGGIQMTAEGVGGSGPSLSFFDAQGVSRMQFTLDAKGTPAVVLRGKSGTVQMGIGLQDDHPVVAVRGVDGKMTPVTLIPMAAPK